MHLGKNHFGDIQTLGPGPLVVLLCDFEQLAIHSSFIVYQQFQRLGRSGVQKLVPAI